MTIKEVSEELGLTQDTLRYYEKLEWYLLLQEQREYKNSNQKHI